MMKWIQQHKIFAMAVAVAVVLSVWYIAGAVKAVTRYVEQFNATYEVKEEPEGQGVNMYRVPGYHDLLKEKGLLSSQVKLARTDSVGLFLNLPDSVAQLMIKGVAVRSIPLQEIGLPSLFSRTSQEALYEWLSEPVLVHTLKATIAKEPVNVVQAPKEDAKVLYRALPEKGRVVITY